MPNLHAHLLELYIQNLLVGLPIRQGSQNTWYLLAVRQIQVHLSLYAWLQNKICRMLNIVMVA